MSPRPLRALALALASACGGDKGGGAPVDAASDGFDRAALVANLADRVFYPAVQSFDEEADRLVAAIDAACAALGGAEEAARRADAQAAWKAAMSVWQRIEVMQLGPVAMDSGALHDAIYSWPTSSSCAVDQEVMAYRNDPANYDLSTKLVNRRGLDALEYVLFAPSLATTCPSLSAPPGWDALSDAEKRAARCAWARVAATEVAAKSQVLVDAWAPDRGDFLGAFRGAGGPGSPFSTAQAALNAVSDAMFYLDTDVKDMKLAEPAGIAPNSLCPIGEPCPALVESPWAPHSKENLIENVRAFEALFKGADGIGFDDFLAALGAADVSARMEADLQAAQAAMDAIPGALADAIVSAPDAVAAAHAAVKKVTDLLKSQFIAVLGLEIPMDAATDND